jgi:hypothetical protein
VYGVKQIHLGQYVTTESEKSKCRIRIPTLEEAIEFQMKTVCSVEINGLYDPSLEPILFNVPEGPYGYLENSYLSNFDIDGKTWPSVEHHF